VHGAFVAIVAKQNVLQGLLVKDAMRTHVIHLPTSTPIDKAINHLIKHKVDALLVTAHRGLPAGVVSKSDIVAAYYASLCISSPLEGIMSCPPAFCNVNDRLESALEQMRSKGVRGLYALGKPGEPVAGVLAYPDVVALLYLYCRKCNRSLATGRRKKQEEDLVPRIRVSEVMRPSAQTVAEDRSISEVIESLSTHRLGAVLITDRAGNPRGVVSMTDIILAYKHRIALNEKVTLIMSSPVRCCDESYFLEDAIREMIFAESHRLFVRRGDPGTIVGVLSLSSAARVRSGSCHACVASRIVVD
jgi:CBS domain-containing protein